MRKLAIFTSILIASVYLSTAINMVLTSGEKLESSNWDNLSSVLNKIDVNSNDLKVNGKLAVNGKICTDSGCLGECDTSEEWDSSTNSCKAVSSGTSCKSILGTPNDKGNGVYLIDVDGAGGTAPFEVYCDMTTAGGGWTMVVAQYEQDPVTNWNEGIQSDYDPSLATKKGFALSTFQLPSDRAQTAFGKDLAPTFVGYSDYVYTTGDLAVETILNKKDNINYQVYRNKNNFHNAHDPEQIDLLNMAIWNNSLTYDETGGEKDSWAFAPNHTNPDYRGRRMKGFSSVSEDYPWTVWVR